MLGGGTYTSAVSLEWVLVKLIHHPEIMKIAQYELDRVGGKNRHVLELNIPNLHYLHAIVKENLCLHPSTPIIMPCVYVKDFQILKYKILANTNVLVNILWAIGCDPKVWKRPLKFNPDQFLGLDINVEKSNYNLVPFGLGHQQCLGLDLQLIVQFVLATIFQHLIGLLNLVLNQKT
jgi:cytochrome P450